MSSMSSWHVLHVNMLLPLLRRSRRIYGHRVSPMYVLFLIYFYSTNYYIQRLCSTCLSLVRHYDNLNMSTADHDAEVNGERGTGQRRDDGMGLKY